MMSRHQMEVEEVEHFARGIQENTSGAFFDVFTMAQAMLSLANLARKEDHARRDLLRDWDALTLGVSVIIENGKDLSKKQILKRLEDLYRGDA